MALVATDAEALTAAASSTFKNTPTSFFTGFSITSGAAFARNFLGAPSIAGVDRWSVSSMAKICGMSSVAGCFGITAGHCLTEISKLVCLKYCHESCITTACFSKTRRDQFFVKYESNDFWDVLYDNIGEIMREGLRRAGATAVMLSAWVSIRSLFVELTKHLSTVLMTLGTALPVAVISGIAFLVALIAFKYVIQRSSCGTLYKLDEWLADLKLSLWNIACSVLTFTLFTLLPPFFGLHGVVLILTGALAFWSGDVVSRVIEMGIKKILGKHEYWTEEKGWNIIFPETPFAKHHGHGCLASCLKCMVPKTWSEQLAERLPIDATTPLRDNAPVTDQPTGQVRPMRVLGPETTEM